jgi:hypothetical protein
MRYFEVTVTPLLLNLLSEVCISCLNLFLMLNMELRKFVDNANYIDIVELLLRSTDEKVRNTSTTATDFI